METDWMQTSFELRASQVVLTICLQDLKALSVLGGGIRVQSVSCSLSARQGLEEFWPQHSVMCWIWSQVAFLRHRRQSRDFLWSGQVPLSQYPITGRTESLKLKTVVGKKDRLIFCLTEFSQFKQTSYWSNTRTIDMNYACMFSCVRLCVTPWTVVCLAPLSIIFSRQEYWSEFPFPSPGDIPDPGIEPGSFASQADSLPSEL